MSNQLHPLEELGIEYHVATEMFDRRICKSYEHSNDAIPLDAWEREQTNRNAMYETHKAQRKANELFGIGGEREVIKWIQKTASHPEVKRRLSQRLSKTDSQAEGSQNALNHPKRKANT